MPNETLDSYQDEQPQDDLSDGSALDQIEYPDGIFFGESERKLAAMNLTEEENLKSEKLSDGERASVARRLQTMPVLSPRQIEALLLERGYRGQEHARRAGAILAYRHLQRIRREFLLHFPEDDLSPREHYLFLGATGSGKTFLTELLFREILGVPTVVADVTRFTETGYIGDDVLMLLSELYEVAGQDRAWASCGVICLDEFDKLAASRSSARFAGEGTTKDVSGFGVQRGLLNLLSGRSSPFPTDFGYSAFGQRLTLPLRNLVFIACGAFSGLKQATNLAGTPANSIGFLPPVIKKDDSLVSRIGLELLEDTRAFAEYGILPELVGRFSRMVPFQPLSAEVLREILEGTVLKTYRKEFEAEQVELVVEEEVCQLVIESALRRETGARAVRAALVPHLEEAAFRAFGEGGGATVRFFVNQGEIDMEVSFLV